MRRWISSLFRVRQFRRANRDWWAGIAETVLAATVALVGVVLLALSLTMAALYSSPDQLYISVGHFSLQLVVATVLIALGAYRIVWLLWRVGVSEERRGAIVSRAGEIELLNEIRRRREDLPTLPLDRFPPTQGNRLQFKLTPSPRNLWGLVTAAAITVGFLVLATILISTMVRSYRAGQIDWYRAGLTVAISLAAGWSIYQFFRQLLKLTGIGATALEISAYPLVPGNTYHASLSQNGRVRLQLLDVFLICQEEATYSQGTDIRTENFECYRHRLIRKRGIWLKPKKPFETEFDFEIPAEGMHSFKSPSNRVQWKIVVTVKGKQWPQLNRSFTITVHPRQLGPGRIST